MLGLYAARDQFVIVAAAEGAKAAVAINRVAEPTARTCPGGRSGTGVPGLYAAGDAAREVQFVIVAAAEGAKAAVDINALQAEERR